MSTLFNTIVQSSSLGFQINCSNLNVKAVNKRENANKKLQENVQEDRRPGKKVEDVEVEKKTYSSMRKNFEEYSGSVKARNQSKNSNYQDGIGITTFAGAVVGGAGTFTAALAAWWIVTGVAIGSGSGYVISKGVSYFCGGNWF